MANVELIKSDVSRAVLGALFAGLCIAGAASAEGPPVTGGTVTMAIGGDPTSINPSLTSNYSSQIIGCMIYQGLVRVSANSEIQPLLAKSWTISEDGKTYTFELVETQWHDGTPFTADDVVYSLTEVSKKLGPIFAQAGDKIETVEALASNRVEVTLKESFGPFLMSLACPQNGAIMPAHIFEGSDPLANEASFTAPVGTGPFKLAEWERGSYLRLIRNDAYFEDGKPYLDEIYVRMIPQASSRLQSLRAGEVDFIGGYYVPPRDYSVIQATPGLKLENSGFAPGAKMLFINVEREPLDDPRVRQALMMATDREFLFEAMWFGTGGGLGVMPFTSKLEWAANFDIDYREMYPFDIERADALLEEAGVTRDADGNRFSVTFVHRPEDADVAQVAEAVRSMWRPLGIDVRIQLAEASAYPEKIYTNGDFDLTVVGYTSYGDPALGISRVFTTAAIGRPFGNASRYSNPTVDELFEKGASTTALVDRAEYYKQVQAILAEDLPVLTLQEYQHEDAASERLLGVWGGQGYGNWQDAWIEQ